MSSRSRALGIASRAFVAALVPLVLAAAAIRPLGGIALAADIPRLEGTITDQAGAIGDRRDEVQAALDDVLEQSDVQVFALFVRTTEELSVTAFIDETARQNSLGGDDALVLVALDDHTDAIWVSNALTITDDEINEVIVDALEPRLRDGDFGGAVIAAARALGEAAGGGTGQGGIDFVTLVGLLLVGAGIVIVAVWLTARLAAWRETGERGRRLAGVARDANARLIAADDRVKAAEEETGFVEAEFGAAEAEPFREAVTEAKRELRAAFAIRQRLDDNDPEEPPERETMLSEIIATVGRANAALDKQAARIEELRSLERDAERILAALPAQIEPVEARLGGAEATVESFATYAPSAWQAVTGNAAEARKGLAGARAAVARGVEALATDRTKAAREIAVAQRGIAGAAALLDAIDKLAGTLRAAANGLAADLEAAAHDLNEARRAIDEDGARQRVVNDLADVEAKFESARSTARARPLDPIEAARRASEARGGAAKLLAVVRRDAEHAARFAAAVDASISAAQTEIDRAADFIETRRSGVRRRARTRLVEAERLLANAVRRREAAPQEAMELAKRADELAGEAYALASSDFERWDSGRRPAPQHADAGALILGAILGSILGGGGRRGAGWDGSPWGSPGPGPGGGGGPFGGSSGGGGWGGGHSSGGGFGGFGGGGGGGHSQGGRW